MRAKATTRPRSRQLPLLLVMFVLLSAASAVAQTPAPQTTVPQVLPVTGTLVGADGKPLTGDTVVTFAIYDEPEGGAPLWVEVQTVTLDDRGRFSVWVGTQGSGLPLEMFQTGLARWMGVQPAGYPEQPRARFLAVPYALKAADAETLGGLPASAYLLSSQSTATTSGSTALRSSGDQLIAATAAKSGSDRDGGVEVAGDAVTNDDVIVVGSLCVGTDCVNGESFSFDTIRLKENNTRITFMDTSTTAGFANRDWRLRANSSASGGLNAFFIDDLGTDYSSGDETASSTPFTIEAGASTNAFYIDSSSRVGFRTSSPVLDLHVTTSNTPAMRLEQTNAGGFTAQTWDIAGNEANFFIRDVTSGSRLPFRIRPGAPTSSLDIAASGNVGIGTASPSTKLDVHGVTTVRNSTGSVVFQTGHVGAGAGYIDVLTDGGLGKTHIGSYVGDNTYFHVGYGGNLGIGTANPTTLLDVQGVATVRNPAGNVVFQTGHAGAAGGYIDVMTDGGLGKTHIGSYSGDPTYFNVGYGGNVGIGTASPDALLDVEGANPSARLTVTTFGIGNSAALEFGAGATTVGVVKMTSESSANVDMVFSAWKANAPTEFLRFDAESGYVGMGTTSPTHPLQMASGAHVTAGGVWTNASSRALKAAIKPLTMEAALAALAALAPVTYVYKADPTDPQVGFIAEDVPELVATSDRKSLAPMDIVAVLTKVTQQQRETIQRQAGQVQALDMRLTAQESELADLRARLAGLERLLLGRQR